MIDSRRWLLAEKIRDEGGVALIVTLMCTSLLMALSMALLVNIDTETRISSNYRDSAEAFYAADAGVERALLDLQSAPDWNTVLNGVTLSTFVDGPPGGQRTLGDGTTLDLTEVTNTVRCGKIATCSDADMNTIADDRPWGTNNPRWQLYAYGPLKDLLPDGLIDSPFYVVVWVADDPSENDGRPLEDGDLASNPGRGVMAMLGHAYGPSGTRRVVESTVARVRPDEPARGVRILSWREIR